MYIKKINTFKDKNIKIISMVIALLMIFSIAHTYVSIQENKNIRTTILLEEAKSITEFFKSFRKVYLETFVDNHIALTEDTIKLIPVKTTNAISEEFAKSLNAKIMLRTVSDRPRNPDNMANEKEKLIIEEFKKTSSKKYIFQEDANYKYSYYEPLYITETCLSCHGSKENAPELIQKRYDKAYNYKLNDLRGVISLEIDKSTLLVAIDNKNRHNVFFILINLIILISTIIFLYLKLKRNHEISQKELLSKNNFLQRKAKEFADLQNALGVSEIISKANINGIITDVNDQFCDVSGYTREELIGKNHNIVRHPDTQDKVFKKMWSSIKNKKVFKGLLKNRRKDGSSYHVDTTIVPLLNEMGEIEEYLALRHYVEDMMNHKVLLQDIIKHSQKSALVIMKIESFDELEEFYTTDVIAKLEEILVKDLLKYCPDGCLFAKVYKLENGEFAFIKDIEDENKFIEEKVPYIKEFQKNIEEVNFLIDGYEFNPTLLISVSTGKEDIYENAKLGLKQLLRSKQKFINANELTKKARVNAQKNIDTIKVIKRAIETDNIISYFQPIYNNRTKTTEKYESLVRLVNENGEIISPYYFLEISKKANYYTEITKIVIDHSFKTLLYIKEDISINLSFLDIEDNDTREYLYDYIDRCQECHRIIIELLEDETAKDFSIIQDFIQRVKKRGIKIAIDDFGAGYSNFERLLEFQPDILKIDGSLIKNINTDSFSRNLVETIQAFAQKENIKTVAEFVHSQEIFDIVNEIGIDYSQGYYISEPKPIKRDEDTLRLI